MKLALFAKKNRWGPTWRGWLLLALVCSGGLLGVAKSLHPFLAVSAPVPANVMVVEGWVADYVFAFALEQWRTGDYQVLCATGGPLEQGSFLVQHSSYADVAANSLTALQFPGDKLVRAPAQRTFRNRTFESAKAAQRRLAELGLEVRGLNVVTEGAHGRRTWVVYSKVFGPKTRVGVWSCPDQRYDPGRWWASSDGVKGTLTEFLGWFYEKVFNGGR